MLLNLDAGEHPEEPEELWAFADILCIACGGHAGDEASMTRVVSFCVARRRAGHSTPRLGAHPSYPDREGFGRESMPAMRDATLQEHLVDQLTALADIAAAHGLTIEYVKPHGALYHDAAKDPGRAIAIVQAATIALGGSVTPIAWSLIGPARGQLADIAHASGVKYLREGFADRRAYADGSLVPRSEPDALITSPPAAATRADELVAASSVDTVCCHADTPGALEIVCAVRAVIRR